MKKDLHANHESWQDLMKSIFKQFHNMPNCRTQRINSPETHALQSGCKLEYAIIPLQASLIDCDVFLGR